MFFSALWLAALADYRALLPSGTTCKDAVLIEHDEALLMALFGFAGSISFDKGSV